MSQCPTRLDLDLPDAVFQSFGYPLADSPSYCAFLFGPTHTEREMVMLLDRILYNNLLHSEQLVQVDSHAAEGKPHVALPSVRKSASSWTYVTASPPDAFFYDHWTSLALGSRTLVTNDFMLCFTYILVTHTRASSLSLLCFLDLEASAEGSTLYTGTAANFKTVCGNVTRGTKPHSYDFIRSAARALYLVRQETECTQLSLGEQTPHGAFVDQRRPFDTVYQLSTKLRRHLVLQFCCDDSTSSYYLPVQTSETEEFSLGAYACELLPERDNPQSLKPRKNLKLFESQLCDLCEANLNAQRSWYGTEKGSRRKNEDLV
ncbi:hypothetical protein CLF_109305 [Clonorchis sinensis]|uniref:Uncharacterized protein n=1 Tax=Clonorchis sinensis TaxID=79923 RepID=G7YJ73_CLOSI|nr:hypothetical protein CLF_109305 [Clonorchis sinensis]